MVSDFDKLGLLRVKGVFETLLYLLPFPEGKQKIDIRMNAGITSNAAVKAFNILKELGLIESKPSFEKLLFGLTEKGKRIAELIKQIQKELDDSDIM